MKRFLTLLALLPLMAFLMQGCMQSKCKDVTTYTIYKPVYMSYDAFRSAVASEAPRQLENPGKIYVKGNYLFINERFEGIHVVDNSNPSSPAMVSFIRIPGNIDMAVYGNNLYADSHMDLVVIDLSDPQNGQEVYRIEDALPPYLGTHPDSGVVVKYLEEVITEEFDCNIGPSFRTEQGWFTADVAITTFGGSPGALNSSTIGGDNPGIGGSMAKFAVALDHLYMIDQSQMHVYRINTNPAMPEKIRQLNVGFNIETLWPYQQHLFIGAANGMYIYNASDPTNPVSVAFYGHINSCDPVVVEGQTAYVTLRSGTECQGFTNQLEVIDLTNISSPQLIATYPMSNPHGLGIDNGTLFICDNKEGLKVYNAADPHKISQNQLSHVTGITTYDIIPLSYAKLALVIGNDGLHQYDYSDPANLVKLSHISVK